MAAILDLLTAAMSRMQVCPLTFGGELAVRSRYDLLGRVSRRLDHEIERERDCASRRYSIRGRNR